MTSITGTSDLQLENNKKPIIEPTHAPSQTKPNSQENEANTRSSRVSKDKVSLSEQGKKTAESENLLALSDEEKKEVEQLKERDREVKAHEQAHAAVGGQYAGSPTYDYQTGPDGNRYAVGGEVSIDVSKESDPEDTILKMQVVRAAALAPAQPSTQDLKVAAQASQLENQARAELSQSSLANENTKEHDKNSDSSNTVSVNSLSNAYLDVQQNKPTTTYYTNA